MAPIAAADAFLPFEPPPTFARPLERPSGYFVAFGEKVNDGVNGDEGVKCDVKFLAKKFDCVNLLVEEKTIDKVKYLTIVDDVNSDEGENLT